METIILVVVIGLVLGLLVMMVKYANHIHHFPQKRDQKVDDEISEPDKKNTDEH